MEKNENRNLIKFNKMYLGSAQGVSKLSNTPYCFVKFLEVNKYGTGDVISLSPESGNLPKICENLVCGDLVEVLLDVENMAGKPVLVDITKKVVDSVIVKR